MKGRIVGRLDGKVAIVTGGAQGMGAATAHLFAAEGARVVIGDVAEGGRVVAEELSECVRFVRQDVRSEDDWRAAVATACDAFSGIDILVNNAAVVHFAAIDELRAEE